MGKSSNPMQEHHRQKRIKEIQKNKQQRIKARDEKVVQTKSVASVQEEIKNLKRRKNLQPAEQQKLQRLEKELKLVQAAAENQPKPATSNSSARQNPRNELDDPRKSIYFDETLNPFGAPPPGKPRLFHAMGGGVTMDVKMAIVPGETLPPPPPPPPPSATMETPSSGPRHFSRQPQHGRQGNKEHQPPPARSQSSHSKNVSQSGAQSESDTPGIELEEETAVSVDPNVQPALPEPSRAVQRSRRHKATVDIWASTEEVVYERQINKVDLEADDVGAAAPKKEKKKDKKKPPLEFCYQDRAGQIQGPYSKAQIQEWFNAGYFPSSTLVRSNRNEHWVPIGSVQALQPEPPKKSNDITKEDRVAALKQERSSSVEDRIAALKKSKVSETHGAAEALSEPGNVEEHVVDEESDEVQRRIAAMRRDILLARSEASSNEPMPSNGAGCSYPDPEPSVNLEQPNAPTAPLPGPSLKEDPPPYCVDDEENGLPHSPPPDYPIDDEGDLAVAPYQIMDGDDEPPPYPLDEDAVGPYPADASGLDIPYPTDMTYHNDPPMEETSGHGEETAIDPNPTGEGEHTVPQHHDVNAGNLQGPSLPPIASKPVVKVDKAVVSMLPTNVLNRKRKQAQLPQLTTNSSKRPNKETNEFGGDYDKFMQEIDEL
eukprot:Nitzschia sp. Nitz4//scaffold7_size249615//114272//116242//NITZ4_001173-RA/size249615-processed-gene-0.194-mRNA-1//-1//CDS//3329558430//549//frame0